MFAVYRNVTSALEPLAPALLSLFAHQESSDLRRERLARRGLSPVETWWHAASLGEVNALEPVLERSRDFCGPFVVTTSTTSGRSLASSRWENRVALAPLDLPRTIQRALDHRRPRSWILVETELWPNSLAAALSREVRVAVVNGRISDKSWPRYRRAASIFRPHLARMAAVAVQRDRDAERFQHLGASPEAIRILGNTKHDRIAAPILAELPWSGAPVWTVGSLRHGEEKTVLEAYRRLRLDHPSLKLVLVPRHPSRWTGFPETLGETGLRMATRSRPRKEDAEADVLWVDTQGELTGIYAASTINMVGGTFVPVGGHSLVEAAVARKPVVYGPHVGNVVEEAGELEARGGGHRVRSEGELASTLSTWFQDPEGARTVGTQAGDAADALRGASERTVAWLLERGVLTTKARHDLTS